jgi:prepilin-type N-terminal cleavage/methylation domain-containing protein
MTDRRICRGFTLVELLVVASIMAIFFALVVTGAKPNVGGQIRRAAQELASVIASTQSRSLGQPSGAALILESGTVSGVAATMSTAVIHADVPPMITGTSTPAGLVLQTPITATIQLAPTNADPEDLASGYKIQLGGGPLSGTIPFQAASPWLNYASGTASAAPVSGTVSFRLTAGQSLWNTIWPAPTRNSSGAANPFVFRVARYPAKADVAIDLPKAVAIDLRYSGIGEDDATIWNQSTWVSSGTAVPGWGTLGGKGALAVIFDSVGGVDGLMQQVFGSLGTRLSQPPTDPIEPIYLLVTARDWIDDTTKPPLSNPQAMWVVLHPQTGRVSVANNVPQLDTDKTALRAARAKARAGVLGAK